MVNELVKLHEGTIQAYSKYGKGSLFVITIPTGIPTQFAANRRLCALTAGASHPNAATGRHSKTVVYSLGRMVDWK